MCVAGMGRLAQCIPELQVGGLSMGQGSGSGRRTVLSSGQLFPPLQPGHTEGRELSTLAGTRQGKNWEELGKLSTAEQGAVARDGSGSLSRPQAPSQKQGPLGGPTSMIGS